MTILFIHCCNLRMLQSLKLVTRVTHSVLDERPTLLDTYWLISSLSGGGMMYEFCTFITGKANSFVSKHTFSNFLRRAIGTARAVFSFITTTKQEEGWILSLHTFLDNAEQTLCSFFICLLATRCTTGRRVFHTSEHSFCWFTIPNRFRTPPMRCCESLKGTIQREISTRNELSRQATKDN